MDREEQYRRRRFKTQDFTSVRGLFEPKYGAKYYMKPSWVAEPPKQGWIYREKKTEIMFMNKKGFLYSLQSL